MSQNNRNYSIKNLLIVGDNEISFDYPVEEVLEISDMLIVLIKSPQGERFYRNIYGISLKEQKVQWQIAKLTYHSEANCPFIGMKFNEGKLYLHNWCDTYLIVDPLTGEILEKGDMK